MDMQPDELGELVWRYCREFGRVSAAMKRVTDLVSVEESKPRSQRDQARLAAWRRRLSGQQRALTCLEVKLRYVRVIT